MAVNILEEDNLAQKKAYPPSDVRCHHLVYLSRVKQFTCRQAHVEQSTFLLYIIFCIPRPASPAPALFDTAVNMFTSFRFAKAPMSVSIIHCCSMSYTARNTRLSFTSYLASHKAQILIHTYIINSCNYKCSPPTKHSPALRRTSPDLTSLTASSAEAQTFVLLGTGGSTAVLYVYPILIRTNVARRCVCTQDGTSREANPVLVRVASIFGWIPRADDSGGLPQ